MATRTFVKLVNLLDVTFFDQTEEQAKNWKWDVLNGVGENCYTENCTTKEMSASDQRRHNRRIVNKEIGMGKMSELNIEITELLQNYGLYKINIVTLAKAYNVDVEWMTDQVNYCYDMMVLESERDDYLSPNIPWQPPQDYQGEWEDIPF